MHAYTGLTGSHLLVSLGLVYALPPSRALLTLEKHLALGTLLSPNRLLDLPPLWNSDPPRVSMTLPIPLLGPGTERCPGSDSEMNG